MARAKTNTAPAEEPAAETAPTPIDQLTDEAQLLDRIKTGIVAFDAAIRDKDMLAAAPYRAEVNRAVTRIIELTEDGDPATVTYRVADQVRAEFGEVPLFGQPGRFVELISGIQCDVIYGGLIQPNLFEVRPVDFEHSWITDEPRIDLGFSGLDPTGFGTVAEWAEACVAKALGKSHRGMWETSKLRDGSAPDPQDPAWQEGGYLYERIRAATERRKNGEQDIDLTEVEGLDAYEFETCQGDVRDDMLRMLKLARVKDGSRVWDLLSEKVQTDAIQIATNRAKETVKKVAEIVLAAGAAEVTGKVDKDIKLSADGLLVPVRVDRNEANLLALNHTLDGEQVVISIGRTREMVGERAPARATPDQKPMFEEEAAA